MLRFIGYALAYAVPCFVVSAIVGWLLSSLEAAALVIGLYVIVMALTEAGLALIAYEDEWEENNYDAH